MNITKYIVLDTETSGTNPAIHGIVQFAAMIVVGDKIVDRYNTLVRPANHLEIDDNALAVSGVTREQIAAAPSESDAWAGFVAVLQKHISKFDKNDKAFVVGYNVGFDDLFVRQWCDRVGERFFGSFRYNDLIDVRSLAARYVALHGDRRSMADFKLGTVANTILGEARVADVVAGRSLHDAMVDLELTYELMLGIDTLTVFHGLTPGESAHAAAHVFAPDSQATIPAETALPVAIPVPDMEEARLPKEAPDVFTSEPEPLPTSLLADDLLAALFDPGFSPDTPKAGPIQEEPPIPEIPAPTATAPQDAEPFNPFNF